MKGIVEEMRDFLAGELRAALSRAVKNGELEVKEVPEFVVEVPREAEYGDFAANLAMLLAKRARVAPRKIAAVIVKNLSPKGTEIERVEVAGPGFINFYLHPAWVYKTIPLIERYGRDYGRADLGKGKKVQVEFVSANPTGLLHMGNARGAALGDSIASILDFAGYDVTREFYINDAGNQIENFSKSLEARYLQQFGVNAEVSEDGYHGEDIIDTVKRFIALHGDRYLKTDSARRKSALVEYALREKLEGIKRSLADFGVHYDVWFSEQSLYDSGELEEVLRELRDRGYLYEKDGASWFKAREFGDEKDEVVVRKNGLPTYFASDIAYHKNKFERGFDWIINVWGADHHGHVSRMKGAVQALGYDPGALTVVIMQLVRLYRGGEIVRMSKRTGRYVTLDELVEEVGRDAARYFFVMRSADSHLDFDLDLAREQSNDNPVYYVQYAHARICSIFRQYAAMAEKTSNAGEVPSAADIVGQGGADDCRQLPAAGAAPPAVEEASPAGRTVPPAVEEASFAAGLVPTASEVDLELLKEEAELALIRKLADFPEEVALAARTLGPHRIARYVHELAGLLHSFYNSHRVITDDPALTKARLVLMNAVRTVLKNGLALLGVDAPERM